MTLPGTTFVVRHYYYSAAWQVIEERVGSATTADRQFVWGVGYIDELVLRERDTNANGTLDERLYALQDANYNVTALADEAGVVVQRFGYDAYGRPEVLDASWASAADGYDWEVRYAGYRYDAATGLYQVRFRYYHPGLGRWVSRDPLGYVDGMSLYEYTDSRPSYSTDPFGLTRLPGVRKVKRYYPWRGPLPGRWARPDYDQDWFRQSVNCDYYAFGNELMSNVVGHAIDAGILQGFGMDVNDTLGGSWLDKGAGKLEDALTHYFENVDPAKGFKLDSCDDDCPEGYHKVSAETYKPDIIRARDFHFSRQDNGVWTDKLARRSVFRCPGPFHMRDSDPQGCYCVCEE